LKLINSHKNEANKIKERTNEENEMEEGEKVNGRGWADGVRCGQAKCTPLLLPV
jgi:hypothetical protein